MDPKVCNAEAQSGDIEIRIATEGDRQGIIEVIKSGFPDDPGCTYKFPNRDKFPKDFEEWTGNDLDAYMQQPEKYTVLVARLSNTAIGYAIWDMDVSVKSNIGDHGIEKRHDANPAHMKEYSDRMSKASSEYFGKYGSKQLGLEWLIVHRDFRRRRAGTMLCDWGRKEAIDRGGGTLTVMASPMGKCLYKALGYQELGVAVAQLGNEAERVEIFVLAKGI